MKIKALKGLTVLVDAEAEEFKYIGYQEVADLPEAIAEDLVLNDMAEIVEESKKTKKEKVVESTDEGDQK